MAFLITVGAALCLAAGSMPALADGGPHTKGVNNGQAGISADSCAGCHRAHTAQAENLLVDEVPALCLTCHGSTSTGATTDVMNGLQYRVGTSHVRGGALLGSLRGGGFETARIDSGNAGRLAYTSGTAVRELPVVPVRSSGQNVTSTHMDVNTPGVGTVWGNGAINSGAGGTTTLTCTSCHNPHGNGYYRILNPIPKGDGGGAAWATTDAYVDDAPLPSVGDARNYTVIQKKGTEGTNSSYLLYAGDVVAGGYDATVGDYFHKKVPWNASNGANDAPNGKPSTFNSQITAWCAQCHTRYLANDTTNLPQLTDSGDAIFAYRHGTNRSACTTCHVAHGSNAQMTGAYSSSETYPGGAAAPAGDSRLLKIDNRGTCQACHDPTGTVTSGTYVGPVPTPVAP